MTVLCSSIISRKDGHLYEIVSCLFTCSADQTKSKLVCTLAEMLEMAKPEDSDIILVMLKDHIKSPSKKDVCESLKDEEEQTTSANKTSSGTCAVLLYNHIFSKLTITVFMHSKIFIHPSIYSFTFIHCLIDSFDSLLIV